MAITQEVNKYEFWEWLQENEGYKNNFSFEGAIAVYEYMENYSEEIGENIDFDPIAWCVEFSEYKNFKELQENYSNIKTIEELQDRTTFLPMYNSEGEEMDSFVIADF
jgi:hypothetical protein